MAAKHKQVPGGAQKQSADEPVSSADTAPAPQRDPYLAEMARRRAGSFGMLKGQISLTLEEAMAPLDDEEIRAWGLD